MTACKAACDRCGASGPLRDAGTVRTDPSGTKRVCAAGCRKPEGFTWRGIKFTPPAPTDERGFYSSEAIEIGEDGRAADWKVHRPKTVWHARLRIGADRFPGVGETREQALDAAAAEARHVAGFIVAMLPAESAPAAPRRKRARAIKVRR
jgi:hypothetical protein